jgi:DNA-binding NarL/FixJ family response regulator
VDAQVGTSAEGFAGPRASEVAVEAISGALSVLARELDGLRSLWPDHSDRARDAMDRLVRELRTLRFLVERALGEHDRPPAELGSLTRRELEVMALIAEGTTTKEIARALGISPSTVRSHVKSILAKLCVHSRIEAVAVLSARSRPEPGREPLLSTGR